VLKEAKNLKSTFVLEGGEFEGGGRLTKKKKT